MKVICLQPQFHLSQFILGLNNPMSKTLGAFAIEVPYGREPFELTDHDLLMHLDRLKAMSIPQKTSRAK